MSNLYFKNNLLAAQGSLKFLLFKENNDENITCKMHISLNSDMGIKQNIEKNNHCSEFSVYWYDDR